MLVFGKGRNPVGFYFISIFLFHHLTGIIIKLPVCTVFDKAVFAVVPSPIKIGKKFSSTSSVKLHKYLVFMNYKNEIQYLLMYRTH